MLQKKVYGHPLIYLDSAATTLKPMVVIDALSSFYKESYGTVHRGVYHLAKEATEQYHAARRKIQTFIHAKYPEEIVFTKGTTDSINLVALSLGEGFFQSGDEILIPETEHHSNIVPWQMLVARKGVKVIPLPVDDDGILLLEELRKQISSKTRLISLAHISNFTGARQPIEEVVAIAKALNIKVFLDAAQSVPHIPVDVQALDVDFLAFSGHKAYGPTGIGILYGKKELLEMMPPVQGGGDMIEQLSFEKMTFQKIPLKFEAGTPMIAQAIGLGAAIDYIEGVGRDKIAQYENELVVYATQKLLEIPRLRIIGQAKNKGAIISFVIAGCHPLDLGTLLDLQGIALRTGQLCTQPAMKRFGVKEVIRASFAPYNTKEEIDNFIAALKQGVSSLS